MDIALVRSEHDRADSLTKVPQRWFDLVKKAAEPPYYESAVLPSEHDSEWISGHPGVRQTLYFIRQVDQTVSKASVRTIVRSASRSTMRWRNGKLGVSDTWSRVGVDITHYQGRHYLSLIDCGASRFSIWRRLRRQDAASVVSHQESLFCERGAPAEMRVDNDTAFRCKVFRDFLANGGFDCISVVCTSPPVMVLWNGVIGAYNGLQQGNSVL